ALVQVDDFERAVFQRRDKHAPGAGVESEMVDPAGYAFKRNRPFERRRRTTERCRLSTSAEEQGKGGQEPEHECPPEHSKGAYGSRGIPARDASLTILSGT